MTATYTDPLVTLHVGDCLEVLPTLEADSVDAVVTDPPYGLGFMAKDWDNAKRMRSIPPSVATRIADGSDVGRLGNYPGGKGQAAVAFDGHAFQAWCEQWGREALRVTKPGGYLLAFGGTRTHHRLVCALEDAGWIIRDELEWIYASGFPKGKANLKPAHEPIVLARKPGPLRPLGIDAGRIGVGSDETVIVRATEQPVEVGIYSPGARPVGEIASANPAGRWPSNVLLSDPELFDQPNPYVVGSGATAGGSGPASGPTLTGESTSNSRGKFNGVDETPFYGDVGGYARFFIVPKSPRAERNRGLTERSSHPTVKPIDLMRHLVRLVTPPGGVVLDPFLGSGTTCLAASEEGFRSIGIERELEYLEIAKGRLMATPMGLGLDTPIVGKKRTMGEGTYTPGVPYSQNAIYGPLKPDEEDAA
jgi:DNA modification methylase